MNEPGSVLSIRKSRERRSISGCSSQACEPSAKIAASGSLSPWRTTITGTPALVAASIARPMFARLVSVGGSLIGSAPSKYSFCTSITISARFGIVAPPGFGQRRTRLRATKRTFAGRSARRRMRYGYHCGPNGVATSTLKPRATSASCSAERTP